MNTMNAKNQNGFIVVAVFVLMTSCQDELDVINPNEPTPENALTELGIIGLAQGAVYINGQSDSKYGGNMQNTVLGLHELMGDVITSADHAGGAYCPDSITLDDGSILPSINDNGQVAYLREYNIASSMANVFYYEWAFMYSLNATLNDVLATLEAIDISDEKKNTVRAWCYFWKGYAYSRVGSMYYAGIITNEAYKTNDVYVAKERMLEEAEKYFILAEEQLTVLADHADYLSTVDKLVPSVCKPGKGGVMTTAEWIRHINTLRARNLLVNTRTSVMTTDQWTKILSLTSNGVRETDNTFTLRTDEAGQLLSIYNYVASTAFGPTSDGGGFYKISERLIQEFKPRDNRLMNNFMEISPWIDPQRDRTTTTNTRYVLLEQGNGIPGVLVYLDRGIGQQELYLSSTYEENILMQAEANINTGNIDAGLALIDGLRNYQGAGLPSVSGTSLVLDEAKEELRRERRVALAFRGFAFYDARRWGVLENGRKGSVVIDFEAVVNTNATVYYGYLDYWDVPIAESFVNPPGKGSTSITNPK